ncbi:MAG TPA: GTPase HflX [Opitutales bacterium]|jgi:GTP-binding protein HflX|nr:GTPase HflX [Opitutales bacterium]
MSSATANSAAPRALLLGLQTPGQSREEAEALLDELAELAANLGMVVPARPLVKLRERNPRFLLGAGKTAEIIAEAKAHDCGIIIFDDELHPAQQRNWEAESGLIVIDRHEVILDIFAARARTREARLQVELAQAEYFFPRLRRAWSHLSRQRGGGVTQRGDGETQLQVDQRLIRERIQRLRADLEIVRKQRDVQRRQRLRVPLPTAAIVGYTNAGKSSLLNALTGAHVLAADKLFATLDPTTRRLRLPTGRTLLMTDTVGFVRRLPHRLVEAFKATLEEALVADLLIHVVDASSPEAAAHHATTLSVLRELGANSARILTVFNKLDRVDDPLLLTELKSQFHDALFVSAHTGAGLDVLLGKLDDFVSEEATSQTLLIPHSRYDLINRLHQAGAVHREQPRDDGVYIEGLLPKRLLDSVREFIIPPPVAQLHPEDSAASHAVA